MILDYIIIAVIFVCIVISSVVGYKFIAAIANYHIQLLATRTDLLNKETNLRQLKSRLKEIEKKIQEYTRKI